MKTTQSQVERVEAAFGVLRRAVVSARERFGTGLQLTRTQLEILILFAEQPVWTIGQLAKRLFLTQSAVTQTVDTLVRHGLVARRPDEHDRRVTRLELAPEGRQLTERVRTLKHQRMEALVSQLSDAEIDTLVTITDKFSTLLQDTN
jgi:DNA-binding MarR family transcriptional regulator